MTRIISAMIIAVTLLIYPGNVTAERDRPSILESVAGLSWTSTDDSTGESVVSNHCSTTAINKKKGYGLTAAHCVTYPGANPYDDWHTWVEPNDFQINGTPATVITVDIGKDLAILRAKWYEGVKQIKVSRTVPTYLDKVMVAGYPFGWSDVAITTGYVSAPSVDLRRYSPFMILHVPIAPGSSGSSILNEDGEIISVVQVGWVGSGFSTMAGGSTYTNLIKFVKPYLP